MGIEAPQVEIDAAEAYQALHVPALFRQWASAVAEAARVKSGDRVLDVACGTGVLATEARARVGERGRVSGLDAGAGMLVVAERLAPSIDWRLGTADALPYDADSFDAVVSQFGLMFFPDRPAALREMVRVLAPDGRVAVAVWESLDRSEAYPLAVDLLERRAGREAADALRAPFVLGDASALAAMLEQAGFESVAVATQHGTARFPSVRTMVEADLRGWLPVMGVHLPDDLIESILTEAEQVLGRYVTARGTVEFDAPAHIATGSAS
jgi:ubiquinone/menaquinone biosynthesis C-methylase UbiE